jgi:hypothetical protein
MAPSSSPSAAANNWLAQHDSFFRLGCCLNTNCAQPARRVLAYRIQKLRTRRPWVLVAGRSRALPVGAGPRYPQWFQEDFHALRELLRGDKIHPSWPTRCSSGRRRRASSSSCHKPHYLSKPLLSSGRPPRCPSDTTPDSAAVVHAVRDRRQRSATAKPGTPPFPPAGHEPTPAGKYSFFYILLRRGPPWKSRVNAAGRAF